ncbi:MAG: hypothetical protein ACXAC6_01160 [Candidatus Hodarchaeales archaeon]|jgi:hypothetical protein
MSRSPKAKEIFNLTVVYGDIEQARTLLKEIVDPLDYAMSQGMICSFLLNFQQSKELLDVLTEIENANKGLQDDILKIIIYFHRFAFYMGFNNPVVSRSECQKYFKFCQELVPQIDFADDWERYYVTGMYKLLQAWYVEYFQNDYICAIQYHRQSIEAWSKMPQVVEELSQFMHINLGETFRRNGQFIEAVETLQLSLSAARKLKNIYQMWPLEGLFWLCFLKGDLIQAQIFAEESIKVARWHNNNFAISNALQLKGFLAFQEGTYDSALKSYQESVAFRKLEDIPLRTFFGHFAIFNLHIARFKLSNDPQYLERAQLLLTNLEELNLANSDATNPTMTNYTKYAHALVFKYGTIRTKSQALDILEELVEIYPKNIEMALNLMELLFEEISLSGNQNTVLQIDALMQKVKEIPLRKNPQAIFSFISQQIIQAKYYYYLKGDVTRALDLLLSANNTLETYELAHLMEEVNQEITDLEKERKKWESADLSLKERIKDSEFKQYLQEALVMVSKDKSS